MKLEFTHAGQVRTLAKHPAVAAALAAGTITAAAAASKPWYLRCTIDGKEQKFKLLAADRDAIRLAKDRLSRIGTDEFAEFLRHKAAKQSLTIGTLAAAWLAAGLPFRKTHLRETPAADRLRATLNRALPWWTAIPVATITATTHEDFAAHRAPALRSADLELAALSSLCQWAVHTGQIAANPFATRARFCTEVKSHCHQACPEDDETLHRLLAVLFDYTADGHHPGATLATKLSAGTLAFCALTGLRPGEPSLLERHPPLAETPAHTKHLPPGTIFPDRAGQLRMKVARLKHGQNPFVSLHPAAVDFLSTWRAWLAAKLPASTQLFPPGSTTDNTTLNRALNLASAALNLPHYKPHAMRAYYVKVRRSQGEDDATISGELGQTTNGALIRSVYGDPQDLIGGSMFDWLPADTAPAWNLLQRDTNRDTSLIRPAAEMILVSTPTCSTPSTAKPA